MSSPNSISIQNKRASFEFHILDVFHAGLVLTGTEVKSIRAGEASLAEAYCIIYKNEVWLKNMHINIYEKGSHYNHEPRRDRKLLLTKREIKKLITKLKDTGITLIPLKLYFSESGFAKLDIAIAKGKKLYDKRDSLKQKDLKREMERGR